MYRTLQTPIATHQYIQSTVCITPVHPYTSKSTANGSHDDRVILEFIESASDSSSSGNGEDRNNVHLNLLFIYFTSRSFGPRSFPVSLRPLSSHSVCQLQNIYDATHRGSPSDSISVLLVTPSRCQSVFLSLSAENR